MKKTTVMISLLTLFSTFNIHADEKAGVRTALEACLTGNSDTTPECVTYINYIDSTFGNRIDPIDANAARICGNKAHSGNITICLSKTVIKKFNETELRVCEKGSNSDTIVTCLDGAGKRIEW